MSSIDENSRTFTLADVLTIISHRDLTDIKSVYAILNHCTGEILYDPLILRAMLFAGPRILAKYPELINIEVPVYPGTRSPSWRAEAIRIWLADLIGVFGNAFSLPSWSAEWNNHKPQRIFRRLGDTTTNE